MKKEINIDPITRLEGHGKITIFLDEKGDVENTYLQIPELRGFERFCIGRRAEDMPQLTSRICGVCPVAHHMASTKALDSAFHTDPPPAAKKLRELLYCGYIIYDHILHFYFLGGPDLIVGPDSTPMDRNILGVIEKTGLDIGREVIKHRSYGQKITSILGGKATHPVCGLPGGVSKGLNDDELREIKEMVKSCVKFSKYTLDLFHDIIKNKDYKKLIESKAYHLNVYNMGLVDDKNRLNFYDGVIRIIDTKGEEHVKFKADEYDRYIAEHVEEWSYMKYPYLRDIGWHGLKDGDGNGLYRVGPLGRLNVIDGITTRGAKKAYDEMIDYTGGKPINSTLMYHWARLIELLYASERAEELTMDESITSSYIRNPVKEPGEGVGVVEAARGTLIHHYDIDRDGLIRKVNLIVASTHNAGAITLSISKAAKGLISKGKVNNGILNMIEMAFRAYDPCFACATHLLPGGLPFDIVIHDKKKQMYRIAYNDNKEGLIIRVS
ncbi:MAG: Ni/Fe hydrogenase subunit alpha [Candidatus Thermoplasmatota archaeon]